LTQGPEFTEVEQPFIDQLVVMGWEHTAGSLEDPAITGRESFREVLLLDDLKEALHRINLDPEGRPWLDEGRIMQAVNALQRLGAGKLLEANQAATELLLKGTVVDGVEGWEQGRGRTVHFIDWDNPQNNRFRVVNQFQVACPAGQADKHIRPDIVLFVNGIPLVIVECKSPYAATPLEDAVDQLQRYANRRRELGLVDLSEGNEQLFHYSQFLVATCGEQARAGTFSSLAVHFLEWKDTSPKPIAGWRKNWVGSPTRSPARKGWSRGCCGPRICSTSCATSPCSWSWVGAG
jgi:type I restriction enzyme R subunit